MSKKPRLQQQREGEEKSVVTSCDWGENIVRESLTDLVGSAMDTPVDSSTLARRRALVKNTSEKASSSVRNMVHAWIVIDVREQHVDG
jgi:hypothetical protein